MYEFSTKQIKKIIANFESKIKAYKKVANALKIQETRNTLRPMLTASSFVISPAVKNLIIDS